LPLAILFALAGPLSAFSAVSTQTGSPANSLQVAAQYFQLPLSFELNEGQAPPSVKALSRGSGYGLFLTATESILALDPGGKRSSTLRLRTLHSNPSPRVSGVEPLPGVTNYLRGNNPAHWRHGIRNYAKIRYESVYPGVDLVYYGKQGQLEYDFIVAPGAEPSLIRLGVDGARRVRIDDNGNLVLETRHASVIHNKPVIYQEIDGVRRFVEGHFALYARNQVGFELSAYDRSRPLIIDPSLAFLTYLGGTVADIAKAITVVNVVGITVIGGSTSSTNFPVTPSSPYPNYNGGDNDAFVAVLDTNGKVNLLTSYIGGNGSDSVTALAVDPQIPPAYFTLAGNTTSANFPLLNAMQTTYKGGGGDGFTMKFDIVGITPIVAQLAFSTYLGGTGLDNLTGLAVANYPAGGGDIFVTGATDSTNIRVTPNAIQPNNAGGVDAFLCRFRTNGTLSYATYLGGTGEDFANGIAVFNQGSVTTVPLPFVAGYTKSSDFPGQSAVGPSALGPGSKAFVVSYATNCLSKLYTKLFGSGGSSATAAQAIAADGLGNVVFTGVTTDPLYPKLHQLQSSKSGPTDAIVTKLDPSGNILFSTFWGGSGGEVGNGVAVDTSANIYFAGATTSTDLPTASAVFGSYAGGASDAFVVRFYNNNLPGVPYTLSYSTYLGGAATDVVYSIVVGSAGNARVAGLTNSSNLPSTAGVLQPAIGGGYDAFVAQITTTP
jgi:hypothetical protein